MVKGIYGIMSLSRSHIVCVADDSEQAQQMRAHLQRHNNFIDEADIAQADVILALGGDGFMLHTMHACLDYRVPIYGMNCGTVGFLMNQCKEKDIRSYLKKAETARLRPLEMEVTTTSGATHQAIAFNEVSLLRETYQAAHIAITVDGAKRVNELVSDGVLVATSAGSTAYNLSVGGPVIPLHAGILALTPISPFRPRRWSGALLPHEAEVVCEVMNPNKRPVSAVADFHEVRDAAKVVIRESKELYIDVLFDHDHSLEERIIKEQFSL